MLQKNLQIVKLNIGSLKDAHLWAAIIFILLTAGCAKIGPPPGGPTDKRGPTILSTSPENGDLRVPLKSNIFITVDEWIDGDSFQNAFFISPEPPGEAKFKIGLHKLTVKFKGGFEPERTYVVTVGTRFKDLRRNEMEKSVTFAFSTGNRLDYGMVQGKIGGDKAGFLAALYHLEEGIDPEEEKGDYLTQSGSEGDFNLSYLPPGDYRLMVFSDKDGDRLYDPGEEELGLSWMDFAVNEDTSRFIFIKTAVRMSSPPHIQSIDARDCEHLAIIIDRQLEFLPDVEDISIVDTLSGDTPSVIEFYMHPLDSCRLILRTAPLDSVDYLLHISGGIDFWGEVMCDSLTFRGNAGRDTLAPALLEYTAEGDSLSGILELVISEPVVEDSLLLGISFPDSFSLKPTPDVEMVSPGRYLITSSQFISRDTIFFNQMALVDEAGNRGIDSTLNIVISPTAAIIESGETGEISGEMIYHGDERIWILFMADGGEVLKRILDGPGPFRLDKIPAGSYTFEAFIDRNGNGRYDYGLLNPFIPAERYTVADQDTFRVRVRWETTGVVIKFD